jgi:hypothetical protein
LLFRLGLALAIGACVIVLAWSEASIDSVAGSVSFGGLFGGFVGVLLGSFVWSVILRAGAAWVERIDVKFSDAYATMLLCGIVGVILGVVVIPVVSAALWPDSEMAVQVAYLSALPLLFLIDAGIIAARHAIRFGRAILVCLVMLAVSAALALTVAGIAYLMRWGYQRMGVLP